MFLTNQNAEIVACILLIVLFPALSRIIENRIYTPKSDNKHSRFFHIGAGFPPVSTIEMSIVCSLHFTPVLQSTLTSSLH